MTSGKPAFIKTKLLPPARTTGKLCSFFALLVEDHTLEEMIDYGYTVADLREMAVSKTKQQMDEMVEIVDILPTTKVGGIHARDKDSVATATLAPLTPWINPGVCRDRRVLDQSAVRFAARKKMRPITLVSICRTLKNQPSRAGMSPMSPIK